jgi:hypothetical protein
MKGLHKSSHKYMTSDVLSITVCICVFNVGAKGLKSRQWVCNKVLIN